MSMRFHFLSSSILFVSLSAFAQQERLVLSDISVLMPLPKTQEEMKDHIYLLTDAPEKVFPAGLEEKLPKLFSTPPGSIRDVYKSLLVTSFRFDPCAPVVGQVGFPKNCQPEVRLVAQFYRVSPGQKAQFDEVSIHLIYELTAKETESLALDLLQLKKSSPVSTDEKSLFVHPGLESGGMGSQWGKAFKAVIHRYARPEKLSRVTGAGFSFDMWPFWSVQIKRNADMSMTVEQKKLSHLVQESSNQTWDIFTNSPLDLGRINPASKVEGGPMFFAWSGNYLQNDKPVDKPEVQSAIDSVERIRNPLLHHAESVDCLSCHVAQFAKVNAERNGVKNWKSDSSYQAPNNVYSRNLTDPLIQGKSANLVQFGYFLRKSANHGLPADASGEKPARPSVSDRVIYESLEAVQYVNEKILKLTP